MKQVARKAELFLLPAHFLIGLLFNPSDESDMFL
jgi:hypothetical protein